MEQARLDCIEAEKARLDCIELEKARLDCIETITASMAALMHRHDTDTRLGRMTEKKYKRDMTLYHNQRIEKEILLGNLPPKAKPKARFRNGLYI
jgi:hypothetical protein